MVVNTSAAAEIRDVLISEGLLYRVGMSKVEDFPDAWPADVGGLPAKPAKCVALIDTPARVVSRPFDGRTYWAYGVRIMSRGLTFDPPRAILSSIVDVLDEKYKKFGIGADYAYQHLMLVSPAILMGRDENDWFVWEARYDAFRW
jgi:hypothetical protein